ncbi:hypothetical protein ACT3CD_08740 [Geofilum sp. OHC36d9]|uniref:hypothetical protein n=1 Tax=Geofilum sp. OHC36d9 TaxID=3458413 RepID=UPI004033D64E
MKKLFGFFVFMALVFAGCAGGSSKPAAEETVVEPAVEVVEETAVVADSAVAVADSTAAVVEEEMPAE